MVNCGPQYIETMSVSAPRLEDSSWWRREFSIDKRCNMQSTSTGLIKKTASLSAMAGIRSMAGPTLLTLVPSSAEGCPFSKMKLLSTGIRALAIGELIADKLPIVPDRIWAPALVARAASGALIGAVVYKRNDESPANGAVVGACSAVATAFATYHTRKFLTKTLRVPDFVVAAVEDAIVLSAVNSVKQDGVTVCGDSSSECKAITMTAE